MEAGLLPLYGLENQLALFKIRGQLNSRKCYYGSHGYRKVYFFVYQSKLLALYFCLSDSGGWGMWQGGFRSLLYVW